MQRLLNFGKPLNQHKWNGAISGVHISPDSIQRSGSVAEWLACWTQAHKGPGSNRSRDAVGQQS